MDFPIYGYSNDFIGEATGMYSTIKEAFDEGKQDIGFDEQGMIYIIRFEKPFKISKDFVDSEIIIEDMCQWAEETDNAAFADADPYPLTPAEYKELNDILAKDIAKYLSKKFDFVEEDGTDEIHAAGTGWLKFNRYGQFIEGNGPGTDLPEGWKIGDEEP